MTKRYEENYFFVPNSSSFYYTVKGLQKHSFLWHWPTRTIRDSWRWCDSQWIRWVPTRVSRSVKESSSSCRSMTTGYFPAPRSESLGSTKRRYHAWNRANSIYNLGSGWTNLQFHFVAVPTVVEYLHAQTQRVADRYQEFQINFHQWQSIEIEAHDSGGYQKLHRRDRFKIVVHHRGESAICFSLITSKFTAI